MSATSRPLFCNTRTTSDPMEWPLLVTVSLRLPQWPAVIMTFQLGLLLFSMTNPEVQNVPLDRLILLPACQGSKSSCLDTVAGATGATCSSTRPPNIRFAASRTAGVISVRPTATTLRLTSTYHWESQGLARRCQAASDATRWRTASSSVLLCVTGVNDT